MDPTQGEKPSKPGIAPSSTSSTKTEKELPPASQSPTPPAPATDQKKDQPEAGPTKDADTDDTFTFKPGDEMYEVIQAAKNAIEAEQTKARTKPKTDTMIVPGAGRMSPAPMTRHTGPLEDRKAAYRHWLQDKSKDELIELLISLETREPPSADLTDKVPTRPKASEELLETPSESYQIPDDLAFIRLPVVRKTALNDPTPTWRVVLVGLDQNSRPIGLQIDGEISIGRAAGDANPDLDLTPFGAKSKGVSRIHAHMRPELHNLILVDSNSSNGTFWNKVRLPPETDQTLKDGDVITFGRVNFLVKVVKPPSTHDTKTLL